MEFIEDKTEGMSIHIPEIINREFKEKLYYYDVLKAVLGTMDEHYVQKERLILLIKEKFEKIVNWKDKPWNKSKFVKQVIVSNNNSDNYYTVDIYTVVNHRSYKYFKIENTNTGKCIYVEIDYMIRVPVKHSSYKK